MASDTLAEYERRRLENIRRNDEMMTSLMLSRKVSDLAATLKRASSDTKKKEDKKNKKPRLGTPVVVRRSLRHRGLPPNLSVPTDHPSDHAPPVDHLPTGPDYKPGPLLIGEALVEGLEPFDRHLIEAILNASDRSGLDLATGEKGEGSLDPKRDLMLRAENVRKILDGRILTVRFLPFGDRTVVVTGDKLGNVGFWDVDTEEGDGVYVYAPHSAPVSGISIHPFSSAKVRKSTLHLTSFTADFVVSDGTIHETCLVLKVSF
ncbi:hypothetical protein GW17_00025439 [Ensete ventricosum]|nr:hypothetical protein GW17_00025439 [Ensete ventricosum]